MRYFKTRSMATAAARNNQIKINDQLTKPSREIYPTDVITLRKNQINYKIQVLDIPKSRLGAKLVDIYRKDITPASEFEASNMIALSRESHRDRGTGRPTKKERRDLEDWFDEPKATATPKDSEE